MVSRLRKVGFVPDARNATGAVILPDRAVAVAATTRPTPRARRRIPAAELAARLHSSTVQPTSPSYAQLSTLAPQLNEAEVALLADALDHAADVRISYRNRAGNRSVRTIRPEVLDDRWVSSWCHLRGAPREFAIAGIESVSPAG